MFKQRHKGYAHQEKILEESKDYQYFGLFWDMGLGKSKTVCDTLAHNFDLGKIDRALILAKKGEYGNWIYSEIPEHWPSELEIETLLYNSYEVHLSSWKKKLERLLAQSPKVFKVLVVNVEALSGKSVQEVLDKFLAKGRAALIADEVTWAKDWKSKRSKTIHKYVPKTVLRRILSGTPVTNGVMDLWGEHLLLKKGILGHSSFYSYRNEYCVMEMQHFGPRAIMKTTGYKNVEKLSEVIKPWSSSLTKEECLDLPEKIYDKRVVELDPEHRRVYDKLRAEAMIELEGEEFEVLHAMALSSKMHQLACGQIKTGPDTYHWHPSVKLDATLDVLESHRGKAIVWCPYKEPLRKLYEVLCENYGRDRVGRFYGGVPDEEREEYVTKFQDKSDHLRFIVANQQSMGYGRTLTAGTLNLYYANDYKLELRLQSADRIYRIGQTEKVMDLDVVARGTVDELVVSALRRKKKLSDVIMDRPMVEWL